MSWFNRKKRDRMLAFGASAPGTYKPAPPALPEDRMYIANREKFEGVIMSARIDHSKSSGAPYIRLEVSYDGLDRVTCVLTRLAYTNYVIREGLQQDYEAQAFNVSRLVGGKARIRFDHKVWPGMIHDHPVPTAIILEILL